MTEQHADQTARMAQLTGWQAGTFDIPMSGVCEAGVDEHGNNFYVTSVIANRDGLFRGAKARLMDNYELPIQYTTNKYRLAALIDDVIGWHHDRNLIDGSTDKDQTLKLAQELGELSDSVCKGKDIRDDIGDMLVVMLNITERNNISLEDCLAKAWEDIKDRKGKMIDGIFVKESDL